MTDDRGDTLVEILVALGLLGIVVAAIAGALIGSASASTNEKEMVTLDAAMRNFAESMRSELTGPGATAYADCATADGGSHPYRIVSQPTPAEGPAGTIVTLFATGYPPSSQITVTEDSSAIPSETVSADRYGDATLSVPVTGAPGHHSLHLTGSSQPLTFDVGGTVQASEDLSNYHIRVDDLQWWQTDQKKYVEADSVPCPKFDPNGLQLVTISGTGPDGLQSSLTFALANPGRLAPTFLSGPVVSFHAGSGGQFTVQTSGYPPPGISSSKCGGDFGGSHISWQDNGDGTATVSWTKKTPAGQYVLCLTASNGVGPDATQTLTIDALGPPDFTSSPSVSFVVGSPGSFTVQASGYPAPGIAFTQCGGDFAGSGISWQGHGDGTATVSWAGDTPAGQYLLCLTASNGVAPDATQTLTIDALAPPAFTSSPSASFPVGPPGGSFTVRTSPGYPAGTSITFAQCGGDFAGSHISWQDNGDGTATVSWTKNTPAGSYQLCLTASNGVSPDATQTLTISFGTVPSIAIAPPRPRIDLRAGDHSVVPLVVGGIPDPTLSITSGALPDGLVLDGGSTAIVGQPSPTDLGDHVVTITATNAVGSASVTVDLYVVAPGG